MVIDLYSSVAAGYAFLPQKRLPAIIVKENPVPNYSPFILMNNTRRLISDAVFFY
jgi:hypothetical protein